MFILNFNVYTTFILIRYIIIIITRIILRIFIKALQKALYSAHNFNI